MADLRTKACNDRWLTGDIMAITMTKNFTYTSNVLPRATVLHKSKGYSSSSFTANYACTLLLTGCAVPYKK